MSNLQHGMVFENEDGELMRIVGEVAGEAHQWEVDTWWNGSWACMGDEVHDSEFAVRRKDLEAN